MDAFRRPDCQILYTTKYRHMGTSTCSCNSLSSVFRFRPKNCAGWSSLAARRAHNPKVTGSNPVPATIKGKGFLGSPLLFAE